LVLDLSSTAEALERSAPVTRCSHAPGSTLNGTYTMSKALALFLRESRVSDCPDAFGPPLQSIVKFDYQASLSQKSSEQSSRRTTTLGQATTLYSQAVSRNCDCSPIQHTRLSSAIPHRTVGSQVQSQASNQYSRDISVYKYSHASVDEAE